MAGFLTITALLLLTTLAPARAAVTSVCTADFHTHWDASPPNGTQAHHTASKAHFGIDRGAVLLAHGAADSPGKDLKKPESEPGDDLDLREVDWEKVRSGGKGKNGNGGNGDKGNGVGEEEDKDEKEGEEEAGAGWNRLWDAPKLG